MRKSITLFISASTFLALAIIAPANKSANHNGMPSGNGFSGDYHYDLTISGRQGDFIDPITEYADKTQDFRRVVFIARDQGNDPLSGEVSL